jgi:hypothetical protein
MKARFQIIEGDKVILDTELQVRNRFTALHELLKLCGVTYDPGDFKERKGWVEYKTDKGTYRTTTRFG